MYKMSNFTAGSKEKEKATLLECYNNSLGQVLSEFIAFLYPLQYARKADTFQYNVYVDSMMIHLRSLSHFFNISSAAESIKKDDLFCTSFYKEVPMIEIDKQDKVNEYINKYFAHITKTRGNMTVRKDDLNKRIETLIKCINWFIEEMDKDNLKAEYKEQLKDEHISELKQVIVNIILDYTYNNKYLSLETKEFSYTTLKEYIKNKPAKKVWPDNLIMAIYKDEPFCINKKAIIENIIDNALECLTPRQEFVVCSYYKDGKTISEISRLLFVNTWNVKTFMNQAIRTLKKRKCLETLIVRSDDK